MENLQDTDWVGSVPQDWEIIRLGRVLNQRIEKNKPVITDKILSLTNKRGVIPYDEKGSVGNKSKDNLEDYNIARPGDIVLNSMNVVIGSVGLSKYFGAISPVYYALFSRNSDLYDIRYYAYVFANKPFQKSLTGLGAGILEIRMRIPMNRLKNVFLPVPPIVEQKAIVDFLDKTVVATNDLIQKTESSISDLLKFKSQKVAELISGANTRRLKDTNIPWMPKIPDDWQAVSLKLLTTKIGSGKTPSGGADVYQDTGVLFIRSQNVYETGLYLENAKFISDVIDEEMKNTRVKKNDVLLNITGGSIGRATLFDLDVPANVNQHVSIIRTNSKMLNPNFLTYYLNSNLGQANVNFYQTGGNREGLNFGEIGKFKIPLPPTISIQNEIVEQLDVQISAIDELVSDKQKLIAELEAFKQSTIYEVVTGKKRV